MQDGCFPHHNRRWYDSLINMTMAVQISQGLSPEIQAVIARHLNEAIDAHRKYRRTDKYAISVGYGRVLGLYKASYGRRWHDPDPLTDRAFNFMVTIPDTYLEELASRIVRVGEYIDLQRETHPLLHERKVLTGQVQGILRDGAVSIRQSRDGIRLKGDFSQPETGHSSLRTRHQSR